MFGRSVWQRPNEHKSVLTHEIRNLTNGIYWLEIQDLKLINEVEQNLLKVEPPRS